MIVAYTGVLLILTSSGTHGSPINLTDFWLVGFCPYAFIKYVGTIARLIHETGIYRCDRGVGLLNLPTAGATHDVIFFPQPLLIYLKLR